MNIILNSMHKTRLHIIRLFALLLLLCGAANDAWAQNKVTYHILTKPFDVRNYNNTGDFRKNIRVEALQCTSEESTIGLPDQFKSPLAKNFRYWTTATSTYDFLYDYNHSGTKIVATKCYIYQCAVGNAYECLSNEVTAGDPVGNNKDIYVTYDYINDDEDPAYRNGILELNGATDYNVEITNSNNKKFLCYNRSRNNRVANALATGLTGEDLASDDFVTPVNDKKQLGWNWSKWGPIGAHLGFRFTGADPYNFTIMTSYIGPELHITDAVTNVDGTGTIKPYAGATLMSKVAATSLWFDASNDRHYKLQSGIKDAGQWTATKYAECKTTYYNTAEQNRYDTWVGFYRYESPTLNTFILLPHPTGNGYMFVGSKMNQGTSNSQTPTINQPNNGQYYTYYDYSDNDGGGRSQPYFRRSALSSAHPTQFYEIRTYTLNVKTHGSGTVLTKQMKWSDAMASENIVDHVPEALKRKYVQFTGAYSDENKTNTITTFADALAANNGNVIWLDYETDTEALPFEFLPEDGIYTNAHWYTMRVNGKAEQKNIAYNSSNDLITGSTSIGSESDLHKGENSADAQVAFMGDPYELKIISRAASEAATANRYVGIGAGDTVGTTLKTNKTASDSIIWEIMYESSDAGNFVLRRFKTVDNPKYIGWSTTDNKPVIYSSDSTRIRVVDLNKVNYTYHIMRSDGSIAIKATVSEYVGKPLQSWMDIPTIIRSPFLAPSYNATVTYYANNTNAITNAPYDYTTNNDIYVRYSFATPLTGGTFNVTLNAEFIYTSATQGDANIYSKGSLIKEGVIDDAANPHYQWVLNYSDPYAMTIHNIGKDGYVKLSSTTPTNNMALSWDDNATLFIAKQSAGNPGFYEVMLATGEDYDAGDGVGVTTTYFNVGRNISSTSENTVKLYQNTTYASGYNQLRFRLIGTEARDIVYHLIDKANHDLLQVTWRHTTDDEPYFPPRYRSPLVSTYYYWSNPACTDTLSNNKIGQVGDVYVTYDVNNLVNLKRGKLYLLKYEAGQMFNEEDGSDGISETARKAIYPYVNGDCNFFVYGQDQYDLQQEGAASTRTRWAWYVQSDVGAMGDPYHVKIRSRQSESYPYTNPSEYNAYFATYQPTGYSKVVTTLTWPGISGIDATEYMVLGNEGQYQLVTTNEINGSRYTVNSFEQYWKTWDTIRKKVYGDKDAKADPNDSITIPRLTKAKFGSSTSTLLRDSLVAAGWHCYENWAYAKRWNGYNNGYNSTDGTPKASKGWEKVEHWYQTVSMGEGYFDFVETSITPVLILLDQHGWEIMRKPLPTSPTDPQREAKYEVIRPYNSPMVKEYAFWATAKKRSGFHQYYLLSDRIGGDDFTSTDLTNLPPYGSKNVLDKKGNLNDQYVTYIVKDEYAQTYAPSTNTGKEFLIEQGSKYASTSDGTTITKNNVPAGGMVAHITNDEIPDTEKWYVKPNSRIDIEMGYNDVSHSWTGANQTNPNAYDYWRYKDSLVATYITTKAIQDSLGYFSFSNGFDPYNIQITPKNYNDTKFIKNNATGATLVEGSLIGSYSETPAVSLNDTINKNITPAPKWFDSRNLAVTNATWMAVQDANGNMQLMPRFDHNLRMSEFGDLIAPTSSDAAKTYTKLYRPVVYDYRFIDNEGHESIRYKSGGDLLPQTPDRFKSPFATNLTYYADAECTDEITESLDGATLTDSKVYVRYEYDEEADDQKILMGKWLTMKLNDKDVQYTTVSSTAGIYYDAATSETKPSPVDGDDKKWQWKFLETPQSTPDPYAVKIYSRDKTDGAVMTSSYALLPHIVGGISNGFMLTCMDGTTGFTYSALTGDSNDATAAANSTGNSEHIAAGTDYDTKCKIILNDGVEHTFIYKVYTNSGVFAISANQTQEDVNSNDWETRIPDVIKSPLLNLDQYRYYSKDNVTFGTGDPIPATDIASVDTIKNLTHLYGLYDDEVVVRYTPYDPSVTEYMVPNVRNATTESTVAKGIGSNDAPLDLSGDLIYNVIWHNDNMMFTSDQSNVVGEANKDITTDNDYEWKIGGNDPYAMTFLNVSANKYITAASAANNAACSLTDNATKFMLLPKSGYEYGMLAITGNEGFNLTIPDDNNTSTNDAAKITTGDPAKFIFFALATHKVIYHLMIKNIGEDIIIPYKGTETNNVLNNYYKIRTGSTMRDLTTQDSSSGEAGHIAGDYYQLGASLKAIGNNNTTGLFARDSIYCYDAGHISLGDELEVPSVFYRPNVNYFFIVEGVYDSTGANEVTLMNDEYKGVMTKNMGIDPGLLGTTVFVNIVYSFDTGLSTNAGSDFVTSVNQNMWYTFETSDATPRLAEFTGELKTTSGYATHYTNDYLWTPVGDPYGFKMYNRYLYKNLGQLTQVMTTTPEEPIASGQAVVMGTEAENKGRDIYELITTSTTTPGYFRVHPMVNKSGTQYYMNSNSSTGALTLSTVPSEWTFGLNEEVMRPYYQAAGYVGGLNEAGKAAYETAAAIQNEFEKLTTIQNIVYNHDNDGSDPENPNYIVHYAPGYYRLHSQPGSSGITTQRYASGYTHKIELTAGDGGTAIPLHFYEQTSYDVNNPDFTDLETGGFTVTPATRGEIPLSTVNNDAASIFYFAEGSADSPLSSMQTQGLYVKDNKMTATVRDSTKFTIVDIGAGIVALQNGVNFLKYAQDTVKYDLKFDNTSATVESARWCMQPVQKGATAGSGEMPLTLIGNNGNDKHFYTTFYAPFDALLTNAATDTAFVVPAGQWPTITPPATIGIMHPKEIGEYNTAENGCPEAYRGSSQFIPANTPVIIRSKSTSSASTSNINLALPTTTPSDSVSCVFSGVYLEQSLPQSHDYNSDHSIDYVYVFGLEYDGTYTEDPDFATNGEIHATAPSPTKVLGFFKNMNRDRESADAKNSWKRNNKYVFGNKIYYRDNPVNGGGDAREFIPVVFDFSDGEEFEEQISPSGERQAAPAGDGCIYDLQGRLVATKDMVEDGSWQYRLSPGIYILNGKKFTKR